MAKRGKRIKCEKCGARYVERPWAHPPAKCQLIQATTRTTNKYHAVRTDNGFPSKLEAAVYQLLILREKAGEIRDIRRQHVVVLQDGPSEERINWKIDFSFVNCATGKTVFAEAKGVKTEAYQLKLKLYRRRRTHRLEIWEAGRGGPVLVETILEAA